MIFGRSTHWKKKSRKEKSFSYVMVPSINSAHIQFQTKCSGHISSNMHSLNNSLCTGSHCTWTNYNQHSISNNLITPIHKKTFLKYLFLGNVFSKTFVSSKIVSPFKTFHSNSFPRKYFSLKPLFQTTFPNNISKSSQLNSFDIPLFWETCWVSR